ncbi:MAG: hypothetical protein ABL883_13990 [Terricaulis sp.]
MRLPSSVSAPGLRAAVKRLGDLLVVYGHGLLAFGVGAIATGAATDAVGPAIAFGVACHAYACYISLRLESAS